MIDPRRRAWASRSAGRTALAALALAILIGASTPVDSSAAARKAPRRAPPMSYPSPFIIPAPDTVKAPPSLAMRVIDRETLLQRPVRGPREAAWSAGGVSQGAGFRADADPEGAPFVLHGGSPDETEFEVDGFPQRDPFDGTLRTSIPNDAIERIEIVPGTAPASAGRAASGRVRVVTRMPSARPSLTLEGLRDASLSWWSGTHDYRQRLVGGTLSGPWLGLPLLVSVERRSLADRSPGVVPDALESDAGSLGAATFDDGRRPSNTLDDWTWFGKTIWRPNPQAALTLGSLGTRRDWREGTQSFLFDAAHTPRDRDRAMSAWAALDLAPHPEASLRATARFTDAQRTRGDGVAFDDFPGYVLPGGNPAFDPSHPQFWSPGHVFPTFTRTRASSWEFRADATQKLDAEHLVTIGGETRMHVLRETVADLSEVQVNPDGSFASVDAFHYGYDALGRHEVNDGPDAAHRPRTSAAWLEDHTARGHTTLDLGVRFDGPDPGVPGVTIAGTDSVGAPIVVRSGGRVGWRASPRFALGVAATPHTVVHLNAGRALQPVDLRSGFAPVPGSPFFPVAAAPRVEASAIAYGAGLTQVIDAGVTFDVAAWYRHARGEGMSGIHDLTARGVDVGARLARRNGLAAELAYTLSSSRGTFVLSGAQRNVAWTSTTVPALEAALDDDRRHVLVFDADLRAGAGEGPVFRGARLLERSGLNVLVRVASGTPYTRTRVYDEVTLAAVAAQPMGEANAERTPWTARVDLKATRAVVVYGMPAEASVWVTNVLGRSNPRTVFSGTGSPYTTGYLATPDGEAFLQNGGPDARARYDLAQTRPDFFDTPRTVRVGLRATF